MKQCKVGMDQENIISTFASTQFYGDPDAYIREFLQNAIDACNTRAALEWSWGTEFLEMEEARALNSMRNPYSPQISIQYNSETQRLVFEDNGIGINARDIEQYVAKIGVSFYQSEDFSTQQLHYEPVAQFGVGMLSGFMVARALLIEKGQIGKYRVECYGSPDVRTGYRKMDRRGGNNGIYQFQPRTVRNQNYAGVTAEICEESVPSEAGARSTALYAVSAISHSDFL